MRSSTIQIRIDQELKENAEAIFIAMGLKTSEAIRIFLQQTINDKALPFQPHLNHPNKATIKAFGEIKKGKYKDQTLKNFKHSLSV